MVPPRLRLGWRRSCYFRSRCCRRARHRACCGSCGCRCGGGSRGQRGRDEAGSLGFGARLGLGRFGLTACLRCFGRLQELRQLGLARLLRSFRRRLLGLGLLGGLCLCTFGGLYVRGRLARRGFGAGGVSRSSRLLLGDLGFGLKSIFFMISKRQTAAGILWSLASDFLLSSSCQGDWELIRYVNL